MQLKGVMKDPDCKSTVVNEYILEYDHQSQQSSGRKGLHYGLWEHSILISAVGKSSQEYESWYGIQIFLQMACSRFENRKASQGVEKET